jgi:hypothetical protein
MFALLLPWAVLFPDRLTGQAAPSAVRALTADEAQALMQRALATEIRAAQDTTHPMRYRLRKTSPRFTSTKEILETKDGDVARLIAIGDQPLSRDDELKEQARLDELLSDPSRQRHRKQSEDDDTARALKILRALPNAFLYQYAGVATGTTGMAQKFTFKPNPNFSPPDLETQALTAMTGELWIDAAQERVTHLEGYLQQDVDFGWGILGRLNKGGWIAIDQAEVSGTQWRIVRFQMQMTGRVLFRTKSFDTIEEQSRFAPVPAGLSYGKAIQMLRTEPAASTQTGH